MGGVKIYYEEYPDGIDENIDLNPEVWDPNRGYSKETDEGIWYEIYVNDDIKKLWPDLDKDEWVNKFHGIHLGVARLQSNNFY